MMIRPTLHAIIKHLLLTSALIHAFSYIPPGNSLPCHSGTFSIFISNCLQSCKTFTGTVVTGLVACVGFNKYTRYTAADSQLFTGLHLANHHMDDWVSCSYIWSIFLVYNSITKCRFIFMVGVNSPPGRLKSFGAIINLWTCNQTDLRRTLELDFNQPCGDSKPNQFGIVLKQTFKNLIVFSCFILVVKSSKKNLSFWVEN